MQRTVFWDFCTISDERMQKMIRKPIIIFCTFSWEIVKNYFPIFFLFWELSFRSTIENRSVLEAIFTLFSIENHIPRHISYHEHSKCTNIQSDWQCMHDISINWVIHLQKTSKRLVSSRIKVIQGHNDMTHFLLFG